MLWPAKGRPEIYQRGKWWVVRWYDPVSKRPRSIRTKCETYAKLMYQQLQESGDDGLHT